MLWNVRRIESSYQNSNFFVYHCTNWTLLFNSKVTFDEGSQGRLAMVFYVWEDHAMLWKVISWEEQSLSGQLQCHSHAKSFMCFIQTAQLRIYIRTSDAVSKEYCSHDELGGFIFDLPPENSMNETSFWTARIAFRSSLNNGDTLSTRMNDNDFLKEIPFSSANVHDRYNPSPSDVLTCEQPVCHKARKSGYYCVGKSIFSYLTRAIIYFLNKVSYPSFLFLTNDDRRMQMSKSLLVHHRLIMVSVRRFDTFDDLSQI